MRVPLSSLSSSSLSSSLLSPSFHRLMQRIKDTVLMVNALHWIGSVKGFGAMAVCQLINNAMTNLTQRVLLMDTVARTQIVTIKNASLSMYIKGLEDRREKSL